MKRSHRTRTAALIALAVLLAPASASAQAQAQAQERQPGFLDNLFGRPQQQAPQPQQAEPAQPQLAQVDNGDVSARIARIESALRQLTGTIEQLQHQNQMLQTQIKRLQDDTEYRFQQMGGRAMPAPGGPPAPAPLGNPQHTDLFNPAQHPNAPGVPRTLGNPGQVATGNLPNNVPEQPIGAPGGRDVGAPLDLNTLAGNPPVAPPANAAPIPQPMGTPQGGQLPPVMGNPGATAKLETLPPNATSTDEYALANGYMQHKDYALAEQAFSDFMRKFPNDRLVSDAQYWLAESRFQQQRYREAAESFLAVSTKYEHSAKAPEALLRLGQSLAALHQKEAACATLAEVGRKYPRAPASVKRGVAQEQKRGHC